MRIAVRLLTVVAALIALALSIGAALLVSMFGTTGSDAWVGVAIGVFTVAFIAGPAALTRTLVRRHRLVGASLLLASWSVLALGAITVLLGGIEAAARP